MLQLRAYTNTEGFYVEAAEVQERDGKFFFGGEAVRQEFGKIGKSLKNVVTPDDFIANYGTDTFRLFEMFSGPLEQSRPWDAKAIAGPYRLLQRIWRTIVDETTGDTHVTDDEVPIELQRLLHPHDRGRPGRVRDAALQHLDRPHHQAQQRDHPGLPQGWHPAGRSPSRWS